MSRLFRIAGVMMVVGALFILAAFIGTPSASAQSCPGGTLQVQNQTGCGLNVRLDANPPIAPFAIGPGAIINIPVPPGTVIKGVISAGGVYYTFPATPPEPACTPAIRASAFCCAKFCLYPHNCILQIIPAPAPCAP